MIKSVLRFLAFPFQLLASVLAVLLIVVVALVNFIRNEEVFQIGRVKDTEGHSVDGFCIITQRGKRNKPTD